MRELDKPWTFPFHKKGSEMEEIEELVCARQWTNGNWNGWPRVVRDGRRLKLMCDAPTNSSWITIAAGRFFFSLFWLVKSAVSGREVVYSWVGGLLRRASFGTGSQSLVLDVECAVWKGRKNLFKRRQSVYSAGAEENERRESRRNAQINRWEAGKKGVERWREKKKLERVY
jgi:hypothetical protein